MVLTGHGPVEGVAKDHPKKDRVSKFCALVWRKAETTHKILANTRIFEGSFRAGGDFPHPEGMYFVHAFAPFGVQSAGPFVECVIIDRKSHYTRGFAFG